MYFLSEKPELLEWIDKLEREYKMEQRDVFETAKALSMHYNSPYVR
jgi:ActR/RegA family two-component response regulator